MSGSLADLLSRMAQGLRATGELLPRILANPRGYPRETMLLAVIVALLVLLTLLTAFVVADTLKAYARARRIRVKRKGLWRHRLATIALVCTGTLLALGIACMSPWVSARCVTCHGAARAVTSWRQGDHSNVACFGCHASPGLMGSLARVAELAGRGLWSGEATGGASAAVYPRSCLTCHGDVLKEVVGGSVSMRHVDVYEAGFPCERCHPDAGHEGQLRAGRLGVSRMGTCLACHDGSRAAAACETCHLRAPLDSTDATRPAGVPTPIRCTGCHGAQATTRCIACHGLELPHPPAFMKVHARTSSRNPALCAKCHETASAQRPCACHTEENLHGTYDRWFPIHGPAAASSQRAACRCHSGSFCEFCHDPGRY